MLLNTTLWNATLNTAKAKAAGRADWLRAIERADRNIRQAKFWSWDGATLTIISKQSGKRYRIEAAGHNCEAQANAHKACWHLAAYRLFVRYSAQLKAATLSQESVAACSSQRRKDERFTSHHVIS